MQRAQIESAIGEGRPFTIKMADERSYHVPHPDFISHPPKGAYVIVYGAEETESLAHFLPLLTMTELTKESAAA